MTRLPSNSGTGRLLRRSLLAVCRLAPVILLQFYFYLPLLQATSVPPSSCCSSAAGCRCAAEKKAGGCCCTAGHAGYTGAVCTAPCGDDSDIEQPTPEKLEFLRFQVTYRFLPAARPAHEREYRAPLSSSSRPPPDPPPRPRSC